MILFNGRQAAEKILKQIKAAIRKEKLTPALAVILVGDDEASKIYLRLKKAKAEKVGIKFQEHHFAAGAKEQEIVDLIKKLNQDQQISGIVVQLPLPAVLNADTIIGAIETKKDVDGFHQENRRLLVLAQKKESGLAPVLPLAILGAITEALSNDLEKIKNKKILALVNSATFGSALKAVLERPGAKVEYVVRNTCLVLGLEKEMRSADILITVCGCPGLIKREMIKEGAILIDAGITRYHDGKVVGDVDCLSVKDKAAFLTPVPGGIGPLTVALLLRNVCLAAGLRGDQK